MMVATRISSNLAPQAGSTKMCQTARVYLRLSKYPKLSIPIVVEFKFRLSFEKLEVGSLGVFHLAVANSSRGFSATWYIFSVDCLHFFHLMFVWSDVALWILLCLVENDFTCFSLCCSYDIVRFLMDNSSKKP